MCLEGLLTMMPSTDDNLMRRQLRIDKDVFVILLIFRIYLIILD